jgi:hypothetical protein
MSEKKDVCGYFKDGFCQYHLRACAEVKPKWCPSIKELEELFGLTGDAK